MLRQFTLQPNEEKRIQFEGRFLVVSQATGPIELNIGGNMPITVDEKDRIHLDSNSPNDRAIRIRNVSGGVNDIELHTSDLLVDKRTGVDVKNALIIADDQRVGIDPSSNIVQAIIQNPVRFDNDENFIKIEPDQCIGINDKKNIVKAFIQHAIQIDADQNVIKIDKDQNEVKATIAHALILEEGQLIGIDPNKNLVKVKRNTKAFLPLDKISFESDNDDDIEKIIEGNTARESLTLTADMTNTAPVWIGNEANHGTPLFPGDRLFVDGANEINLVAPKDQIVYVSETVVEVA